MQYRPFVRAIARAKAMTIGHKTNALMAMQACLAWIWIGLFAGCHMTAPMHTWRAAQVPKSGVVRVAVAPVGGSPEVAQRMQNALKLAQPQPNPMVAALHPPELAEVGGIQLVSYDNQPNDMATLKAARQAGMDYILQGYIVNANLDIPPPDPREKRRFRIFKRTEPVESLSVHWTITEVKSGLKIKEETIALDRLQAEKQYPDLNMHTPGGDGRVLMASARKSWAMVAPTNDKMDATLDLPWFWQGSSQVRKGNGYARQGRWDMAEVEWQEAASLHPWNTAAWTNLSLAAVAKEDFQLAHDRLKHADTFLPGDATVPTLIWIEQRQLEHDHAVNAAPSTTARALGIPAKPIRPEDVPTSPPRDLKEMPWWTVIPFIPPPGWTWKQWWSQPIVL
jgi:hypothetical protein